MQAVDKFRSDLDRAARKTSGSDSARLESLRLFFLREFPSVSKETMAALFDCFREKWSSGEEGALAWLGAVGSILLQDYDGSPLSTRDWQDLRDALSLGAEEMDLELLGYAMSLVLDHRAL
jgi:hypothetical protein